MLDYYVASASGNLQNTIRLLNEIVPCEQLGLTKELLGFYLVLWMLFPKATRHFDRTMLPLP